MELKYVACAILIGIPFFVWMGLLTASAMTMSSWRRVVTLSAMLPMALMYAALVALFAVNVSGKNAKLDNDGLQRMLPWYNLAATHSESGEPTHGGKP